MDKHHPNRSGRINSAGKSTRSSPNARADRPRFRDKGPATELLFGFHSVYEALKAGRRSFETVFISEGRTRHRAEKIRAMAEKKGIKLESCDVKHLDRLTGEVVHQGIAARVSAFPTRRAMAVPDEIRNSETPCFILVIETIEDPQNLGALIRTALCAGVNYILIPKNRCALPSPTVSRTSAGAMEHAKIFMITNTASLLRELKHAGAWIAGLDAHGDTSLYEADLTGHIALVIGGEHRGIRPAVQKECDFLLSIPISGAVNSLNASVAGGIAMFEARRQRNIIPG